MSNQAVPQFDEEWDAGRVCLSDRRLPPLVPALRHINVGTYFLELCTPRAGDIEVLKSLPDDRRIGVGVVNQKHERIESVEEIVVKAERAIALFGIDRVLLNPDCGFATFADNPVTSGTIAAKRLAVIAAATQRLRAHRHLAA